MNDYELQRVTKFSEKYFPKQYLQFKKIHPDAVLPSKVHATDAGVDITAININTKDDLVIYDTGLAVEVPGGYVGLLYPRSSIYKYNLLLANHVGVIDADYRGEIKFIFRKIKNNSVTKIYNIGDRIGQLVLTPIVITIPMFVDNLSETARDSGGWGSTGT